MLFLSAFQASAKLLPFEHWVWAFQSAHSTSLQGFPAWLNAMKAAD
jgi:hypothetical protein